MILNAKNAAKYININQASTGTGEKYMPNADKYRPDGTQKGDGWIGVLDTIQGKDMTEYSIGVNIDGKEILIPTLVPSLTQEEVKYLLTEPKKIPKSIVDKAVKHAMPLLQQGISPFKRQGYNK